MPLDRHSSYRDAIRLLEVASSRYAAMGAAGLLARVAHDLAAVAWDAAARTHPPIPDPARVSIVDAAALTATERRVAAAVTDGLSNREVALRLSVSTKTVEFHLANVFRKLGVRNRTELARRLTG